MCVHEIQNYRVMRTASCDSVVPACDLQSAFECGIRSPFQHRASILQLPRKRLKLNLAFSCSSSTASAMTFFKPETNQTTETISSSPSSQTESGGLRCATSVFHGVSMSYWILLNFSQSRSSSDPRPILFLWFSFWERERGVALLKWIIKIIQVR